MILFVFEGVKREPDLFRTIQRLYFSNREEQIVCSYNNNIYQFYKDLQEYDGDGDIVSLLMEKFASQKDNPLKGIDRSADISEIYLFFDYGFHNRNLSLEEINRLYFPEKGCHLGTNRSDNLFQGSTPVFSIVT